MSIFLLLILYPNNVNARAHHVVGAGLGRTGTLSFKRAVEQLGVGPVFHMEDSFDRPDLIPYWETLSKLTPISYQSGNGRPVWPPRNDDDDTEEVREERIHILKQILGIASNNNDNPKVYQSAMDFPTCIYFPEVIEAYKNISRIEDIKVILTKRESGEKWANSVLHSIINWHPFKRKWGIKFLFFVIPPFRKSDVMLHNTFFRYFPLSFDTQDEMELLSRYHDDWNDYVRDFMSRYAIKQRIPLNKILLEFEVKQGWEPLCRFLEIPDSDCPSEEPFPHINDKAQYQKVLFFFNVIGCSIATVMLVVTIYVLRLLVGNVASKKPDKKGGKQS